MVAFVLLDTVVIVSPNFFGCQVVKAFMCLKFIETILIHILYGLIAGVFSPIDKLNHTYLRNRYSTTNTCGIVIFLKVTANHAALIIAFLSTMIH